MYSPEEKLDPKTGYQKMKELLLLRPLFSYDDHLQVQTFFSILIYVLHVSFWSSLSYRYIEHCWDC